MSQRSKIVKITRTGDYFECVFPPIQRRGIQRNGCGALLFGALPCAIGPLVMIYIVQILSNNRPHAHEGMVARIGTIFISLWVWGIIGLGAIFTTLFMAVALRTFLKGGKAWLTIKGHSLKAGHFFGGELVNRTVNLDKNANVRLKHLPKESDHVQRGQIRITGPDIDNDVVIGEGYPMQDLEKVADELQEYIRGFEA